MSGVKTMKIKIGLRKSFSSRDHLSPLVGRSFNSTGQALVEFTLVFLLLLIIAWIPADFGLAMYTGQIAQNASREGARIAAADPTLAVGTTTCDLPDCYALDQNGALYRMAVRVSSALLPGATITLNRAAVAATCDAMVTARVEGTYNYFFYRLLSWFGVGGNLNDVNMVRETRMRWEHQC